MEVTVGCNNRGTKWQYFVLLRATNGMELGGAPNNWKTEAGARRWAEKNGFTVV